MVPQRDAVDFVAALAVGAALGAGAVLLLRPPEPRTRRVARRVGLLLQGRNARSLFRRVADRARRGGG